MLSVTCLFIAGKLEEHMNPNSVQILLDLESVNSTKYEKSAMLELESTILYELEFNLRTVSPLDFLGRF